MMLSMDEKIRFLGKLVVDCHRKMAKKDAF